MRSIWDPDVTCETLRMIHFVLGNVLMEVTLKNNNLFLVPKVGLFNET